MVRQPLAKHCGKLCFFALTLFKQRFRICFPTNALNMTLGFIQRNQSFIRKFWVNITNSCFELWGPSRSPCTCLWNSILGSYILSRMRFRNISFDYTGTHPIKSKTTTLNLVLRSGTSVKRLKLFKCMWHIKPMFHECRNEVGVAMVSISICFLTKWYIVDECAQV